MKLRLACTPLLAALAASPPGCTSDEPEDTGSVSASASNSDGSTSASSQSSSQTASETQDTGSSGSTTTTTTAATDTATGEGSTGAPDVPGCQGAALVGSHGPSIAPAIGADRDAALGADGFDDLEQDDDPQAGTTGVGFIKDPDGGGVTIECSVWEQDCPTDEKCMPWANDGGNAWNATRCSPVDPSPAGVGEACTAEGSGVSGVDDCELGAMCWNVDTETNQGECVGFCGGSEVAPVCPELTECSISNQGVLILCLPLCNPLATSDCAEGLGCYPTGDVFACAPDASGESGAVGDACEYVNDCDPGSVCVNAALVPGCAGSTGCCSSACEVGDDSPCADGQSCVPWFEEGQEPHECLDGLGVCTTAGN